MNKQQIHDAGRFNRQLSIENEIEIADGLGGFIREHEVQGSVWAHICPAKAMISIAGELESQEISHRISFRFRSGIYRGTRFTTGSRKFDVLTVRDSDETRRYLECEVIEL